MAETASLTEHVTKRTSPASRCRPPLSRRVVPCRPGSGTTGRPFVLGRLRDRRQTSSPRMPTARSCAAPGPPRIFIPAATTASSSKRRPTVRRDSAARCQGQVDRRARRAGRRRARLGDGQGGAHVRDGKGTQRDTRPSARPRAASPSRRRAIGSPSRITTARACGFPIPRRRPTSTNGRARTSASPSRRTAASS